MAKLEVHAGTGGKDAELFAAEIAQSISKATGLTAEVEGKVHSFYSI